MGEVKRVFKPEFLNRVDDIIVFSQLSSDEIRQIAAKMLGTLKERLSASEITSEFTNEAIEKIANMGFDPTYGARPLRRAIQSGIEDMLAEKILDGSIKKGDHITITFENEKFTVK